MKKFSILLLWCFISTALFAQSSKEEKVWQQVEALSKAVFETKDSMAMQDLVSNGLTYGHSGGNLEDKPTMVHKAAISKTIYKNSSLERVFLQMDRKTAVTRHNFRAISVENEKETPLDLSILQVWKKEGNNWRLWARQAVKIPPKS